MKRFSCDGNVVQSGVPFELNGLAYPWNWLDLASPEDLKAHGFVVEEVPDASPVPEIITPRQARLALEQAGLLEKIEQAVAASNKPTQISWEWASEIRRDDPIINTMKVSLAISDAQLDALFKQAAEL